MEIMINCAQDWTYDLYVRDLNAYGPEERDAQEDYNAYFIGFIKRAADRFLGEWKKQHDGKLYDHGYVGDAFADHIREWFSDFYKDTYRQRPHLPMWFYVHPLGLPMQEDTARTFCANPVERAAEEAIRARENLA